MKRKFTLWLLLICLSLLSVTAVALAEKDGIGFRLDWWTVDGGGGKSTGDAFALQGTIGQPDAGEMSGDAYVLYGGFWRAPRSSQTTSHTYRLYIPHVQNGALD